MTYQTAKLLLGLFVVALASAHAQEWTRFRGPNGTGISQAKTIPTIWTEKDINWKVSLPGAGHSSPVLWGDRIFVTGADAKQGGIEVLGIEARNGREVWRRKFDLRPFSKHKFNSFASPTPAVDRERVYVCWSMPERYSLLALDHDGKTVWERDLGPFVSQHGCGASPIVHGDLVVLPNEQDGESFIIAMDGKTGKTRWQTPRRASTAAYSTPCLYEAEGGKAVLIFNSQSHGIYAVDPGEGRVVWEFDQAFDKRSVSSPVIAGDRIFGSCGSGAGGNFVTVIRAGDAERGRKPEVGYQIRKSAPYVPTSVVMGDLAWLVSDGGIVTCLRHASGEVLWQERVEGSFFASPIWVDGRLFLVSTSGEVVVLKAADRFEVLAKYPLRETCHSTPAVAGGRMYIRTESHLYSIGGRKDT